MVEVQQLCVLKKELETHEKPSSSQNISSSLISLLLNLQQHFKKHTEEMWLLQFIFPLIATRGNSSLFFQLALGIKLIVVGSYNFYVACKVTFVRSVFVHNQFYK